MNKLTLIGIPIGNLEDITIRGIKAIFSFDIILAEDTRNYIKLRNLLSERFPEIINSLNLDKEHRPQLISYREQNHKAVIGKILTLLETNFKIGFMSDAGMPLISDPGFKLVEEVVKGGFEVEVVPGPSAVDSALVVSGLPTDKFTFLGFLPREAGKIKKLFKEKLEKRNSKFETFIYYDSPYRLKRNLETISTLSKEVRVSVCNDITKKFELIYRGTIMEVLDNLNAKKVAGEWVVVIQL
ncbi:MAG: 16S rRNA (cytidine(1402)-2'-O)-methyltransferase [Candidatus Dojkabacteria bacterium]